MRTLAVAIAATSMLVAVPAIAAKGGNGNGNAYGHGPRVCLITYDQALSQGLPLEHVTKAQYLPLGVALKKDTDHSLLVTYGPSGATGEGIDHPQILVDDAATDPTMTTEEACNAIQAYVEENNDDSDD